MKRFVLVFALAVGLLVSATTMAQVNMSRYITLTVTNGAAIKLDFLAAAAATPIRIVSGSNTQDITVGTNWTGITSYTANASTMTIYGDLKGFACQQNGANLTDLDPSHNTQLTTLWCNGNELSSLDVSRNTQLTILYCRDNKLNSLDISHNTQLTTLNCSSNTLTSLDVSKNTQLTALICHGNNFSTAALDDIYCALPVRQASDNARIQPVYDSLSSNNATVIATNKQNAIDKNWNVQYYKGDADITTNGIYVCGTMNLDTYITLTVKQYSAIKLDFKAAAAGTPVHIVNGSTRRTITVDTDWKGTDYYTAAVSTKMKIYGDLTGFSCGGNRASLTTIDVSKNTQLEILDCYDNQLSNLDVSRNTKLTYLNCSGNNLDSLDLSQNTKLTYLNCHGNAFTTEVIDDIYCALPVRQAADDARIYPLINSSDPKATTVAATNAQNAIAKNWKVRYASNGTDIPLTTGTYECGTPHTDIAEATAEPQLTLYPNPVADVLYLSVTARTIRVYDIYGTEVAHATDTDRVEVSHLPAGVYTVKADGTIAKMVKR